MGSPLYDLTRLLVELFTQNELERVLRRLPHGSEIGVHLPAHSNSPMDFADQSVAVLQRRGMINQDLFNALIMERPLRCEEIGRVARSWKIGLDPADLSGSERDNQQASEATRDGGAGEESGVSGPASYAHQEAARFVHIFIIAVSGLLSLSAIIGGIYAVSQAARSQSEFEALGIQLKTGDVGVALIGLGLIIAYFTMRSVLKNQHDLAKLPAEDHSVYRPGRRKLPRREGPDRRPK